MALVRPTTLTRLTGEWGGVGARQTATAPACTFFSHMPNKKRKCLCHPTVVRAKEERRLLIRGWRNKEKHKSSNGFFFFFFSLVQENIFTVCACWWHSNERLNCCCCSNVNSDSAVEQKGVRLSSLHCKRSSSLMSQNGGPVFFSFLQSNVNVKLFFIHKRKRQNCF